MLCIAMLGMLVWDAVVNSLRGSGSAYLYGELALTGTVTVAVAGLLYALILLLSRGVTTAQLGFGLLAREPSRNLRVVLDDMVSISSLSDQQLLTGFAVYCTRQLWPALLAFVLAATLLAACIYGEYSSDPHPGVHVLYLLPAVALVAASTLLSCLNLCAWCVSLSLTRRQGTYAALAAVGAVIAQCELFLLAAFMWAEGVGQLEDSWLTEPQAAQVVLITLLLPPFGLYLSRRIDLLRPSLAVGLPLLIPAAVVVLGLITSFSENRSPFELFWAAQAYGTVSLAQFGLLPALGFSHPSDWGNPLPLWRIYVLPLLQLAVLFILAEFARDALRRRRWGSPVREG